MKLHQLLTALLLSITCVSSVEGQSLSYGDVNGDGAIDIADVNYLLATLYASGPAPIAPSIALDFELNSGRFIDNLDGTKTDTLTNVMWKKVPLHEINSNGHPQPISGGVANGLLALDALNQVDQYDDWRIADVSEVYSVLPYRSLIVMDSNSGGTNIFLDRNLALLSESPVIDAVEWREAEIVATGSPVPGSSFLAFGGAFLTSVPSNNLNNAAYETSPYVGLRKNASAPGRYEVTPNFAPSGSRYYFAVRDLGVETTPGDVNNDGFLDISDPTGLINYLFGGGNPPADFGLQLSYEQYDQNTRFVDSGNGTVLDNKLGLEWNKEPMHFIMSNGNIRGTSGASSDPIERVAQSVDEWNQNDSFGDWRLATIEELMSLYPVDCVGNYYAPNLPFIAWAFQGSSDGFFVSESLMEISGNPLYDVYSWIVDTPGVNFVDKAFPLISSSSTLQCDIAAPQNLGYCDEFFAIRFKTDFTYGFPVSNVYTDAVVEDLCRLSSFRFGVLVRKAN